MPYIREIIGQPHIKTHLQQAVKTQRISHAYLISGEELSGKKRIATTFAMAIMCQNRGEDGEPCGECSACIRVSRGAHPDVRVVTHEKNTSIRVSEIITQVVDDVVLTPYDGEKKIYIIPDAELMTTEAQNKLLKTLEEPPRYAHFFLLTTVADAILATIRSRLVPLALRPVSDTLLLSHLEASGCTPYRAQLAVRFARGNTGKAIRLAADDDFIERMRTALEMMEQIADAPLSDISERVFGVLGETYDNRLTREELMLLIRMLIRDIGIYKATEQASYLIFEDRLEYIRGVAPGVSWRDLRTALKAVEQAKERIDAHVGAQFALESMMLRVRDTLGR